MNHELIHALRSLDLFTQAEWATLRSYVENTTVPGDPKGRTYLQIAEQLYADKFHGIVDEETGNVIQHPSMNADDVYEEGVAEAFRGYMKNPKTFVGKPRSLMDRMKNFLRKFGNFMLVNEFTSGEDIFEKIRAGEIGTRDRGEVRTIQHSERIWFQRRLASLADQ